MNEILEKYNQLSPDLQKQVNDFLDFMLEKYKVEKAFDMKSWKNKILNISTWTDEDVKAFDEGRQHFSQWKVEEW
ncbi:DUF2281 domain-containing protein [Aquiflexum lacus]|uniref:DUF2281 domain-containing protein n=1 Tax=Aquiflexum lacus TaxID=2483805 RepID=UPI0018930B8D|nr:DUF2281 domain-containing protein [Aquiflexum lacus]